jgi:Cellulose biosynthesis protein BcsS
MPRVATAAAIIVTAAALSVHAGAAPRKAPADGREAVHAYEPDTPFRLEFDPSRLWQFIQPKNWWPPFGLGDAPKITIGGPEQRHVEEHLFLYFLGSDVWPQWAFAHSGVLWSPAGLTNEGFTLKLLLNTGAYRYVSGALNNSTVLGQQWSVAAMPGWRFKRNNVELTVFAGLDLQQFRYYPDDLTASLRGRYTGLRAAFELWYEPTSATMMAADASVSSIGAGNSVRLAYGWRAFDRFYLGPEVQAYSTGSYSLVRAGVHLTALRYADREWYGAVGYGQDSDNRSGLYIRTGVLIREAGFIPRLRLFE